MQDISVQMRKAGDLIAAADACQTVEDLLALAKSNGIPVQTESTSPASEPSDDITEDEPELETEEISLDVLKEQVKGEIRDKARRTYIARQRYLKLHPEEKTSGSKERLVREIKACPTIDKLFELVKTEHIVIPMKSFSSASGLPKVKPELKPEGSPLERLKEQVLDAIIDKAPTVTEQPKPETPAPQPESPEDRLIRAIEICPTIDKLFELVKQEHIVIQMKSFSSASGLPQYKPELKPEGSPLDRLKEQVLNAVRAQYRPQPNHSKEQLLRAVDTCPSIDKLFALVKQERIPLRMKSFSSASALPRQTFGKDELKPDKLPLDRLKEQVREAILNSR